MTDRLLCLLVVFLSGSPVPDILSNASKAALFAALALALAFQMHRRQLAPAGRDLAILGAFAALVVLHVGVFGFEVVDASLAFLVRLAVAMLAILTVPDFHRHYVRVMYALAWLSFAFYLPVVLGVDLRSLFAPVRVPLEGPHAEVVHILVHNFHNPDNQARNSGIFHEPGSFAGYLVLAILLSVFETGRAARKRVLVLLAAVLTTLSTTAYAALAPMLVMLVAAKRLRVDPRSVYAYVVTAALVTGAAGWIAFETLPFGRAKVASHLDDIAAGVPWAKRDRIGNLLYDLNHIRKRPLTGWTPRHATREGLDRDVLESVSGQGNGLSGFVVRYGLVGLAVFVAAAYGGFRRMYGHGLLAGLAMSVVAILLSGQQYLDGSLFLSLMFVPVGLARGAFAEPRAEAARGARSLPPGILPPIPSPIVRPFPGSATTSPPR